MGVNLLHKPFKNPPGMDGKANHYIYPGLVAINDAFATNRMKISTECATLLREIENYAYKENGAPEGKDHLCDAMRYGFQMLVQDWGEPLGNFKKDRWNNNEDSSHSNWSYG